MKRLHVHVSVADLDQSIRFYSTLFAATPSVTKPDYAKWMLDDPRVNFAISTHSGKASGLDHLGIQVETPDELQEVYGRLQQADRPVLDEGATTCCYAQSEKSWIADPQGLSWETFLTSGESTVYGDSADLGPIRTTTTEDGACCAPKPASAPSMGLFERYLTLWVALCIVVGIGAGQAVPGLFHALGTATIAEINLPVAVLVWLMIIPMLLKIDLGALGQVAGHWRGIAATVGINWLVKPFSMALLGWLFIAHLFRPLLPAGQIDGYIAGLILLAAAPCTAMVFVWSNLVDGEPHFTLSQVALNDAIMIVAFAPLVALLLGLSSITVPWATLILSVLLYIIVPVVVAQLWRRSLLRSRGGEAALARTLRTLGPLSLSALLLTLVLLFGLQGEQIMRQPLVILPLAVPILIQVYFNAGLAYWLNRKLGVAWCVAGPSALIGASNFFELAVATAIALFGFQSGAALSTVVGVLVEVPVMLSVVQIVRRSRGWYERGIA